MSAPDVVDPEVALTPRSATHLGRVDQAINEAERQVEEQEMRVGQAARGSGDPAPEVFELQKLQLLVAILREGRERLAERAWGSDPRLCEREHLQP
jgi:hypothetical protein